MMLLAAIALIALGPKQLPEVARVIGRFLNDMKKVRDEFTRTIIDARDSADAQLRDQRDRAPTENYNQALARETYPSHSFDPLPAALSSAHPSDERTVGVTNDPASEPAGIDISAGIAEEIRSREIAAHPTDDEALDAKNQLSFHLAPHGESND